VPNLKFLASTVREILVGPKIEQLGHVTPHDHFWPNFKFLSLELPAVRLRAKFEVSSFNRSRDIRGPKIPKLGHVTPMTPFDPILNFFRKNSPPSVSVPNSNFLASTVREILGRSQNSKIGSRDPHMKLFDPILNFFFVRAHRHPSPYQIWSFLLQRSRDIRGPKIPKLGHVNPHDQI